MFFGGSGGGRLICARGSCQIFLVDLSHQYCVTRSTHTHRQRLMVKSWCFITTIGLTTGHWQKTQSVIFFLGLSLYELGNGLVVAIDWLHLINTTWPAINCHKALQHILAWRLAELHGCRGHSRGLATVDHLQKSNIEDDCFETSVCHSRWWSVHINIIRSKNHGTFFSAELSVGHHPLRVHISSTINTIWRGKEEFIHNSAERFREASSMLDCSSHVPKWPY